MKKIALLIAGVVGIASFALLSLYKRRLEERLSGGGPTPVLLATRDVAIGETLTEDMVAMRDLPANFVEERHILASEANMAIGVRVSMGLRANESILWTDIAGSSFERRDLSGLVQHGMRALTVAVGRGSTLGGLLRPGDRIDLLLTIVGLEDEDRTLPVLQNVLVLAVGTNTGESKSSRTQTRNSDLTLSVTADQAQAITHARSMGNLTVSLRNPEDILVVKDIPATTDKDLHESLAKLQQARGFVSSLNRLKDRPAQKEIEHVR